MAKIPDPAHSTAALIDKYHESHQERPRPHMGASQIGHHCERWLWLSFRHAVVEKFPGRILRLFRRGHNEEASVIADLEAIGCKIIADDGRGGQWRVDFGSHVSGSIDGMITEGLPESPKKPHLLEIKTHSKKSFSDLIRNGVKKSKPIHWAQMQAYMHGTGSERALYAAVCKDDDQYCFERVRYDQSEAERLIDRARRIATSDEMPPPVSTDPSWYQCGFCPAYKNCHQGEPIKQANCRTCRWSTALPDSTWRCEKWGDTIPAEVQYQRHDCWELHDHMAELGEKINAT